MASDRMPPVRIGTWNLAGRWSLDHRDLLLGADCDLWLLTEVSERTVLPGYAVHCTSARMAARRRWAGIASRLPMASLPDPHPASAAAQVGGVTFVSSVLPWRSAGSRPPWVGAKHAEKTANTVGDLLSTSAPLAHSCGAATGTTRSPAASTPARSPGARPSPQPSPSSGSSCRPRTWRTESTDC